MRISVARRNLFRQKARLAMSVGGVGFSVALILLVFGMYTGWMGKSTAYIRAIPADLWVTARGGPPTLLATVSVMAADSGFSLEGVEGVKAVQPFLGRQIVFRLKGKDTSLLAIAVDSEEGLAAPEVLAGRRIPGPNEIVLDSSFARMHDMRIGDTLTVKNVSLKVVGISTGTDALITWYGFTDTATAVKLFESVASDFAPEVAGNTGSLASFFLVQASQDPDLVAKRIEHELPEFTAYTRARFVQATIDSSAAVTPVLYILVLIAYAIGAAVTGLTIYTATVEKAREYGVLKAIGFSNRRLYRVVGEQSVVAALLGFVFGVVLTAVGSALLAAVFPVFSTRFSPSSVVLVLVLCVLMSLTAALVPARKVAAIDPAQVFRA